MTKPGKMRVVITRAKDQAEEFAERLRSDGFEPVFVPTIRIEPPENWHAVDRAILGIADYAITAFTSSNAVRMFHERFMKILPRANLQQISTAAIGERTAAALKTLGFRVEAVPESPRAAEEFAEELKKKFSLDGKRVLFPRAAEGRDVLQSELEKAGATVDLVVVYRTQASEEGREELTRLLTTGAAVWITFASGSAVDGFFALVDADKT